MNASTEIMNPRYIDIVRGSVVNEVMASMEYINSCQTDHVVSPATLSMFSYSIHFVSKPIH